MGVVYKVKFPDGSFYIGATVNLENRMMQHRYNSTNKPLKEKIKEFKMSKADFIQLFSVLHEGEDFREIEKEIIERCKSSELLLNVSGVKYYYKGYTYTGRRRLEFTVENNIYVSAQSMMKDMELDIEGLISKLITDAELIKQEAAKGKG